MFGQDQYEFVRNLPAQKSQEYGKPKNLPEQGCCIVGMGQTSNTSAVHEILERSKKGFLLNVNQAGTFIVIHGTSKIFPLSSPPIVSSFGQTLWATNLRLLHSFPLFSMVLKGEWWVPALCTMVNTQQ